MQLERTLGRGVVIGLASTLLACPAFYYVDTDVDRTPTVDTGAGASIIYPGQSAPPVPGGAQPREPAPGSPPSGSAPQPPYAGAAAAQPPPEYRQPYGASTARSSSSPGGGGVTMIGGSEVDVKTHRKVRAEPLYWKYLMAPFAVLAAPFKYGADKVRGEPEPGPPLPQAQVAPPPAPAPTPVDYETAKLREMERELSRQVSAPPPSTPQPAGRARPGGISIAEELAALRGAGATPDAVAPPRMPAQAPEPAPRAADPRPTGALERSLVTASGTVDRNGDGRTDHWIFREDGEISREMFDENFDGRPDRTLHYDLSSHRVSSIEEDSNQDGSLDTWTELRDGAVVRRRVDSDNDGLVDSWSFYRDGQITRLERDSSGNGFRDHVAHYRDGRLEREEEDDDGDGQPDLIKHYDASEHVVRVEEDSDGDGRLDVISHYEQGRLARRELLDASLLGAEEPGDVGRN
ncbi:MAG: hypothetical protein OEY15_04050 [Myxococcales bacterium]|nr:hypothetical protein [Myxococcales bacterium]